MIQKKIVFVCLGNICRSPLAEAIFKEKVKAKMIAHYFEVDSCGTSNYQIGDQPDSRTIANASKHGIYMNHIARQLKKSDLDYFDLIVAMDGKNLQHIVNLAENDTHRNKVLLIRDFDVHAKGADVPDPYYGGEKNFQEVFEILDRSVESFIQNIESSIIRTS
ncbi:MAG: low molecular weight protein-tyrosine-phosphatase [Chryseolinea sp.]